MRYGILCNDYDKQTTSGDSITNIGSIAMTIAQEQLLIQLGIAESEIIHIQYDDIDKYSGDYVAVLMNMHWMQDVGNKKLFSMSERIIPVFLSLSLNDTTLTDEQASFLRKYEPIGCRDDRTMHIMRDHGVDAYVFGCLALTLPISKCGKNDKVFFADVPYGVLKYIPDKIKGNIEFVRHELRVDELPDGMTPRKYAEYIIEKYKREAKIIVTSRFHGAVLAMAIGIPTIVINENFTFRFSWLKKLVPFYMRNEYEKIDWNPEPIDIRNIIENMLRIAKNKIDQIEEKYDDCYKQSAILEYENWSEASLVDYYDEAINYIARNWRKDQEIKYAFWGVNNNAKAINKFITENYPNATLTKIYDTFKSLTFEGIKSLSPNAICKEDCTFIFVTTFVAGYFAEKIFEDKNISSNKFFICKRRYIQAQDIYYSKEDKSSK